MIGAALCVGACGDDGSDVDAFIQVSQNLASKLCSCASEFGLGTQTDCEAQFAITGSERSCLESTYERNKESLQDSVDCELAAAEAFSDCIGGLQCSELTAFSSCNEQFTLDTERCPQAPAAVDAEFDDCTD